MYEILVVEAYRYSKGQEVLARILDCKNDIWWFEENDSTLEQVVFLTGKKATYNLGMENDVEAVMLCDAIRFTFHFCPDPGLRHFDSNGALYCEFVYAENKEMFDEDLPKFASIINQKLSGNEWDSEASFYALYEIDVDEYRDNDGHLDEVTVHPTFIGEVDLAKVAFALAAQNKP